MSDSGLCAVTGAFGYSGKYIARRLLENGCRVVTFTNSPDRSDAFGGRIKAYPFHFDQPEKLIESLQGVSVLYNTYWVRFNHKTFSHATAIDNSTTLFDAARRAGVQRVVHISISNPSEDSPFEYFRGKAKLEKVLRETGLSHAILRPAVLFGHEDILINNIAWILRSFPVFGIFGDGSYRLQPIHVDDLALLAVEHGERSDNSITNAIGPETFSFRELVQTLGLIIGKLRPLVFLPPSVGALAGALIGSILEDVLITRDEIEGLMAGLLSVDAPPTGTTRLTAWARENAATLGIRYASELERRRQ